MPNNCKVVHCTVEELEDRLNQIEGAWAPMCWNFYPDGAVQRAVVVFGRVVQQMQMPAPPPNLRVRN